MWILTNRQAAWWCHALQLPSEKMLWNPSIPTQAIAEVNKDVQRAVGTVDRGKHGRYKRYSSTLRAEIAKYARQYGAANHTALFEEARETVKREHCEQVST